MKFFLVGEAALSYQEKRRRKRAQVFKIKLREPIFSDHAESLEEKLRILLREECVQADIEDSITGNTTSTDDRDEEEET